MFQSFLETRKSSSVYKVDCQCLSEVEYVLDDILPYCDIKEQHYKNVSVLDKNYNQFSYNGITYSINTYKQNRNIKFVSVEAQEEREYSREDSGKENSVNSHISSNYTSSTTSINTSDSHLNESGLSESDLSNSNSNNSNLTSNTSSNTSFNSSFNTTTTAEAISTYLFEEMCSRMCSQLCDTTPTEYTGSNYTSNHTSNCTNGFLNANANEYNLLENSCVKKYQHQRDNLNDSDTSNDSSTDTSTSITNLINNMYSSKTSFTEYYLISEKHFSGQNYEIAVYSIYQNNYMVKTFVLFDDVYLFRYFYKEPYLFDTFQSIIGHYGYINNEHLQKDKMYYFYKIDHLERYAIKLYVYQLNQGKWCSWNAETNIILGLDLSRPFYIIQFLESIDDKQEKIYIDLLNRTGTNIDDRVMFIQNIFGKEFVYPRQSTSMSQNDQGVIIETSEGSTRQFLW